MRDNGFGECATDSCIPFSNSVSSEDRPAALDVSYHFGETNIGGTTHRMRMGLFLVRSRHYSESQREDQC